MVNDSIKASPPTTCQRVWQTEPKMGCRQAQKYYALSDDVMTPAGAEALPTR